MVRKRQGAMLAAIGLFLLALAVWFAFLRGWAYGAKATIAGVFGLSYLLVGVLALHSDSVPQLFRRTIYSLPVAYLGLFVALQSATVLAYGSVAPIPETAVRALWATLLGYPVGMGYIYGRSTTTSGERTVVIAALTSVLAGSFLGSTVWTDIWPSSIGMRFFLLSFVAVFLVILGALPAYLIPTLEDRTSIG